MSLAPSVSASRVTTHGVGIAIVLMVVFTLLPIAATVAMLLAYQYVSGVAVALGAPVVFLLVLRQVNAFTVSVGLHRGAAHKHFEMHPLLEKPMRVWNFLWGGSTRVWAVMHRIHHAESDTNDDPHSPNKDGGSMWNIFQQTSSSYFAVARNLDKYAKYDVGMPDDAFEKLTVWASKKGPLGIALTRGPVILGMFTLFFGLPVALCMVPGAMFSLWSGTILIENGVAHRWGYRALPTRDQSTNVFPLDLIGYGELMHHNHHASPGSANLAVQPWELDIGYWLLVGLSKVGLVSGLKS